MNENINLCEILKDCPKGTKLYSTIYGEVEFQEVNQTDNPIIVLSYLHDTCNHKVVAIKRCFTSAGKFDVFYKGDECILFPSKEQRDWSKWVCPIPKEQRFNPKTLKPFDKIIVRYESCCWNIELFGFFCEDNNTKCSSGTKWPYAIPYNEETKHLLGTSEEAPEYYRYWED